MKENTHKEAEKQEHNCDLLQPPSCDTDVAVWTKMNNQ